MLHRATSTKSAHLKAAMIWNLASGTKNNIEVILQRNISDAVAGCDINWGSSAEIKLFTPVTRVHVGHRCTFVRTSDFQSRGQMHIR